MAKAKAEAKGESSFEQNLEQLEAIVTALEEGQLSLDDALKQFERGIGLAQACEKALSTAEKKIEILTRNAAGELSTAPFDPETGEARRGAEPADAEAGEDDMSGEGSLF